MPIQGHTASSRRAGGHSQTACGLEAVLPACRLEGVLFRVSTQALPVFIGDLQQVIYRLCKDGSSSKNVAGAPCGYPTAGRCGPWQTHRADGWPPPTWLFMTPSAFFFTMLPAVNLIKDPILDAMVFHSSLA